jgi:phosphate starvation-inducible PhoH-like protein
MSQARRTSKSDNRKGRRDARNRSDKHNNLVQAVIEERAARTQKPKTKTGLVVALNPGQKAYDAAIRSSDVVFGIGPAGTGKTWFAVQRAVEAYKAGLIEKIYVTRPAVEVERGMGFLPGELDEKFDPYLKPLEEAFIEAFGGEAQYGWAVEAGVIDPRPLAFMRGCTLKNGWLLADEMQNATQTEFKMLLTRFGEAAKFIINGDPRQIDQNIRSGLQDAVNRTSTIAGVSTVTFAKTDIVRHGLVQKFVEAYEEPSNSDYYADNEDSTSGLNRFLNASSANIGRTY